MTPPARYVVSPYLVDVGETPALAGFRERHGIDVRQVFDLVSFRSAVIAPDDQSLLDAVTAGGGLLAPDADPARVERLSARGVLLREEDAYRKHHYLTVEIEINRHCNFRCSFCPVKYDPKPRELMPDALYQTVLDRVVEYGAPTVSLNAYSEPLLDPGFLVRLAQAKERGLTIKLFSNASLLDAAKVDALGELGNVIEIVVNLPTVDPEEYGRITGSSPKIFERVVGNLRLLYEAKLPVSLSINVPKDRSDEELQRINERFADMLGDSAPAPTNSRAGAMTDADYAAQVRHTGALNGCAMSFVELPVTYQGKVALCFQDYDQAYELGDLRTQSIAEIAEGERAVEIRRWLYGPDAPPEDLICNACVWTSPATPYSVGGDDSEQLAQRLKRLVVNASAGKDRSARPR